MKKPGSKRRAPAASAVLAGSETCRTVGDWLGWAEALYESQALALGQIATTAHDEALYLILREGMDAREAAQAQLNWRYGHSRAAKTGILDHVFVHYERARAKNGVSFADWLQNGYDPAAISADFKPAPLADLFASRWTGHE